MTETGSGRRSSAEERRAGAKFWGRSKGTARAGGCAVRRVGAVVNEVAVGMG